MSCLPRIFFDTNEGDPRVAYWLTLPLSKADLRTLDPQPREGMLVTIYMPDELEMEATLRWNDDLVAWAAVPLPSTIRYLDGTNATGS
ncbi:hypothetical protein MZO42_01045 [Sphingomonas psychrotolerans]|uniref:Uncharacterized protein n=1 Tax=Sphingomonas psychrotolerans TaxID=1327635 RepID=A0ABU3MZ65_9SPHN|nr:hypothetical protein [Sphingomonas psychrotolerans]MDT8757271.1 hypothetical protein [Sphingomonas psychrotolerans]